MKQLLSLAELIDAQSLTSIAPVYICPICKTHYKKESTALKCATRTDMLKPVAAVGDIVCMELGYGWHDAIDEAWVIDKKGYKFHDNHTYRFWFAVTAITQRSSYSQDEVADTARHAIIYHVQTLGLRNGSPEGRGGWTTPDGHVGFKKVDFAPPASVVEQTKALVGKTFSNLL